MDSAVREGSSRPPARSVNVLRAASVVVVVAASFGGVSTVRAADAICAGSLSGNVAGNVFVGSGVSCRISQANIGGNVQLKPGAALFIDGRLYPSVTGGKVSALLEGAVTVQGDV